MLDPFSIIVVEGGGRSERRPQTCKWLVGLKWYWRKIRKLVQSTEQLTKILSARSRPTALRVIMPERNALFPDFDGLVHIDWCDSRKALLVQPLCNAHRSPRTVPVVLSGADSCNYGERLQQVNRGGVPMQQRGARVA